MAAAQVRYDHTKSNWIQTAKRAQSEKDKARAEYDDQKDAGLTGNLSFTEWAPMNAPAFTQAYRYFQEAEAGYLAAFQDVDSSGLEKWQKKRNNELAPLRHSNDLDKSQFIIYTGEE